MEFENSQVDYGGKSATSSRIDGGAERCGAQSITSLIHPIEESILRYLILKILILSSSDIGSAFHFTAGRFWPAH